MKRSYDNLDESSVVNDTNVIQKRRGVGFNQNVTFTDFMCVCDQTGKTSFVLFDEETDVLVSTQVITGSVYLRDINGVYYTRPVATRLRPARPVVARDFGQCFNQTSSSIDPSVFKDDDGVIEKRRKQDRLANMMRHDEFNLGTCKTMTDVWGMEMMLRLEKEIEAHFLDGRALNYYILNGARSVNRDEFLQHRVLGYMCTMDNASEVALSCLSHNWETSYDNLCATRHFRNGLRSLGISSDQLTRYPGIQMLKMLVTLISGRSASGTRNPRDHLHTTDFPDMYIGSKKLKRVGVRLWMASLLHSIPSSPSDDLTESISLPHFSSAQDTHDSVATTMWSLLPSVTSQLLSTER